VTSHAATAYTDATATVRADVSAAAAADADVGRAMARAVARDADADVGRGWTRSMALDADAEVRGRGRRGAADVDVDADVTVTVATVAAAAAADVPDALAVMMVALVHDDVDVVVDEHAEAGTHDVHACDVPAVYAAPDGDVDLDWARRGAYLDESARVDGRFGVPGHLHRVNGAVVTVDVHDHLEPWRGRLLMEDPRVHLAVVLHDDLDRSLFDDDDVTAVARLGHDDVGLDLDGGGCLRRAGRRRRRGIVTPAHAERGRQHRDEDDCLHGVLLCRNAGTPRASGADPARMNRTRLRRVLFILLWGTKPS
jgi:hypothetical protein